MAISIRLNEVNCNLESTSGFSKRRRRIRRKRASDELQVMIAVLNNTSGELLDTYNYVREDVDTGDTFRPNDLILSAADNDATEIKIRLIALELDGVGKTSKIARSNYSKWVKSQRFSTTGNQDHNAVGLGFISPFFIAAFRHIAEPDLLAFDELIINVNNIRGTERLENIPEEPSPLTRARTEAILNSGGEVTGHSTRHIPVDMTRAVSFSSGSTSRLSATMLYKSEEAFSEYEFKLTFGI